MNCICGEQMEMIRRTNKMPLVIRAYECEECGWNTSSWNTMWDDYCERMVHGFQGNYRQCRNKAKLYDDEIDELRCRVHQPRTTK